MFDIDTINQINREQRQEMKEQRKAILSKKISPVKKQAQWNALCFPTYEKSVIPY